MLALNREKPFSAISFLAVNFDETLSFREMIAEPASVRTCSTPHALVQIYDKGILGCNFFRD